MAQVSIKSPYNPYTRAYSEGGEYCVYESKESK